MNGFDQVPQLDMELPSLAGQQLSGDLIPRTYDHREIMYSDMAEDLTPRQQEAVQAGPGLLARAASMPLGFLAYAAGTIDKPFAAMRGLLAGHPEQLSLLLPFSESKLKPLYESIGIHIPDEHIMGRQVLESWGVAPPNVEGFHPILNPTDAVFDVLGLAADILITPPFLPGIGGLTAKGKTAFGLAKKIAQEAETLAKAASGVTKAIPETAAETFLNVAERRNPAVTLAGKFREIGRGERSAIGLHPMWPWNKFLSPIDSGGWIPPTPEIPIVSPGARAARSLFDWSTMGQTSRVGQNSAQVISENTHQLRSAALNLSVLADEYNAGMGNSFSKIAQYAELGGGDTVKLTFEHLARFIAENHHLKKRTEMEFADEVIRRLMPRAPAEATAMEHASIQKWIMDYRDFVENSMLKPATELFETNLKLGYPYGYLADTVNDFFPRYLAEGIMKKGEEAYGIKALQPAMKSREFGYKNNPGGALSSELAANDSILAAPVAKSTTPAGYTTHTTGPNGEWWQKDEWVVTPNGKTGRIVGFSQEGALVKPIAGEPEEFLLSELNRRGAAGPANRLDFMQPTGMTVMEQEEAALARLDYVGYPTDNLIGLRGKQKWFKARQHMMVERYHVPFVDPSDPDAIEVFFTHPDTQKALRAAAKAKSSKDPAKEIETHFRDYLTGKGLSKKTTASVIEHMRDYGGTSAATLKKIGQFRGETPTLYETGLPNQLWKYMNSQADRTATLAGVHDGLLSSITVHDPKRNVVSILKNVFFGGEDPGGISLEEVYGSLGVKRGDKLEKLRPVGLKTVVDAWKAKNPEAAAIAEEIRVAKETAGPTIFRGEMEAKEPVSLASVLRVPVEVQNTLQKILTLSSSPKDYLPFEKMVRQYTSWFSRWVTGPRLAFHMRNKTGDMVRLATADAPWTTADIFRNDAIFWKGVHGKGPIPYADEVNFIGDAMDSVRHSDISLIDPASKLLHQPGIPVGGFPNVLAALKTPWKGWTNIESYKPWMKAGPTPLGEEVVHPVLKAGERMFRLVEASSKYAAYASAREGGMNPGQAMAMVKRVMYDYSTMSPWEKRIAQPTMMFYGWFRSNIAYMLPRIAFQWPSKVAQTTRALGRLPAQSDEVMPTWLQETFAIPLPTGKTADGKTEVIRNFGLPMEDLAFFGPTVHETLMKAIAKTNPIIKGIYTAASGKDPFTDQVVAQKPGGMLGQLALGVTPAGVYLNNAKKLFPPEAETIVPSWGEGLMRVLDASTGINVGKYNLKMQSLRDLQKQLHGELESTKNVRFYERPYVPPRFGEPPPETEKKIGEYRTLGTLMTLYGGVPRPVPRQTSNLLGE